ncbi:MAG: hypothetical protein H7196_00805 [candidate division SR1 bacterium]|nr:hypothetical protein [candidate division SR1 bacterium]
MESNFSTVDANNSYPKRLIKYTINCLLYLGSIIPVELYFTNQADSPNLKIRKYKNGVYSEISSATKTHITVGGVPTVKVIYNITDGGDLYEGGEANGEIVDPVSLTPTTPTQVTREGSANTTKKEKI